MLRRDSNKFKECCCLSGRTNIVHSNQYCHIVDICIISLTTVSIAEIDLRASNGNRPATASFAARHHGKRFGETGEICTTAVDNIF